MEEFEAHFVEVTAETASGAPLEMIDTVLIPGTKLAVRRIIRVFPSTFAIGPDGEIAVSPIAGVESCGYCLN